MDLDYKAVIQFAHIARSRSFSRSAQELGVSQPWLSGRIRRLEERLGTTLFDRTTRRVDLTPEGEQLLAAAQTLAQGAEAFSLAAAELRGQGGRIRIGTPPYGLDVEERFTLIERFASATGAVVELEIGWSKLLIERLHAGRLDAAFLVDPFDATDLDTVLIKMMELAILIRSDHPLAAHDRLAPDLLHGHSLGVFARNLNPVLFDLLYAPLRQAGVSLIELAELRPALLHDGSHRSLAGLSVIRPALDHKIADTPDFSVMPIDGVAAVGFRLARRKSGASRACERFWSMVSLADR